MVEKSVLVGLVSAGALLGASSVLLISLVINDTLHATIVAQIICAIIWVVAYYMGK